MYQFTTSFSYLINKVGVRIGELFSRDLAPYGVALPMYRVLAALSERGDQRLIELSVMTTIEVTTLSRLVGALKRKKLVTSARAASDERSIQINLTTKGRALAAELMAVAAHNESVTVSPLGENEIAVLRRSLERVFDKLDELERDRAKAGSKPPAPRHAPRGRKQ
jgi:MarR family transcriptional regulator, organic hydroperoxide resistance regulator